MSRFPLVALGESVEPSGEVITVEPGGRYPNAGILNRGRGLFEKPELDGSETSYRTLNVLRTGDLVYSRLFGWEGAVAVVPEAFDGYCVSAEFPVLRARPDMVLPEYLAHIARWPDFHTALAGRTTGMGNRRQRVPLERFLSVEIPLPPIDEQRRIAHRVDMVAALAVRVSLKFDEAERVLRAALAALYGGDAPPTPLSELLRQVERTVAVEQTESYRVMGVKSFGAGAFDAGTRDGSETSYATLRRVAEGDFVFPKLMAWEGAFVVVPAALDGFVVSPEFCTFVPDEGRVDLTYLDHLFRLPSTWEQVAGRSIGTNVRRRRLYPNDFLAKTVPVPPLAEQKHRARIIDRLDRSAIGRRRQREWLEATTTSLINQVFAT